MSISTSFHFRNVNDLNYIKAITGAPEDLKEWEDYNGSILDRPGAEIENAESIVQETDDEYGGWIISIKDIPKEATHIIIYRS